MYLELKGKASLFQKPLKQAEGKSNEKFFILVVTSILICGFTLQNLN